METSQQAAINPFQRRHLVADVGGMRTGRPRRSRAMLDGADAIKPTVYG
jgi:hypothetical protein